VHINKNISEINMKKIVALILLTTITLFTQVLKKVHPAMNQEELKKSILAVNLELPKNIRYV
jgi:hypothetical protein